MAVGLTELNKDSLKMVVHRLEVLMEQHSMYSYQCQNFSGYKILQI